MELIFQENVDKIDFDEKRQFKALHYSNKDVAKKNRDGSKWVKDDQINQVTYISCASRA